MRCTQLEQDLLVSIPAWEDEAGRPFLVHGQSMLRLLMETVSATDQENQNKRKQAPSRAGTVPPRATTPAFTLGARSATGVVTPAVRPGSSLSKSAPNKRPRLGESNSKPAPLGTHRGQHAVNGTSGGRPVSPAKGKTPSSLPRPVGVPKPGKALGIPHGYQQQRATTNPLAVSTSSYHYGVSTAVNVAKKASRARRESFKPRASVDENGGWAGGGSGTRRWGFGGMPVKEEDEEY
jgi:Ase1/PRC1/MAP65 family protein